MPFSVGRSPIVGMLLDRQQERTGRDADRAGRAVEQRVDGEAIGGDGAVRETACARAVRPWRRSAGAFGCTGVHAQTEPENG